MVLADGEMPVGDLVDRLGWPQPMVSKHLGVLRAGGLVLVRADGRHRWYRVNGPALRPVHDWVRRFSELRLGTEFDLVPTVPQPVQPAHFE